LRRYRENNPEFSVLDLKSHYRGCRYASETIKLLPQKPDGILLAEIFEQIARLGMVHPAFEPSSTSLLALVLYNESIFWFGFRKIHKKGGTPLCY